MERLPGEPLGAAPFAAAQTSSLGQALRRTYDVPLEAVRRAGVTERRYGPSTLPGTVIDWLGDS